MTTKDRLHDSSGVSRRDMMRLGAGGIGFGLFGTIQNRQRANTSHTSVVERRNIEEGNVQHDVHEVRDVRDDRRDV